MTLALPFDEFAEHCLECKGDNRKCSLDNAECCILFNNYLEDWYQNYYNGEDINEMC
jgi:hypothetical protein